MTHSEDTVPLPIPEVKPDTAFESSESSGTAVTSPTSPNASPPTHSRLNPARAFVRRYLGLLLGAAFMTFWATGYGIKQAGSDGSITSFLMINAVVLAILSLTVVLLFTPAKGGKALGVCIFGTLSALVLWAFFSSSIPPQINRDQFRSMIGPITLSMVSEEPQMLQGQQIGVKITTAIALPKDVPLNYHGTAVLDALLSGPLLYPTYVKDAEYLSFYNVYPSKRITTADGRLLADIPDIKTHRSLPYGRTGDGSIKLKAGTYYASTVYWFPGLRLPDESKTSTTDTAVPCRRAFEASSQAITDDSERTTYVSLSGRISISGPYRRGPYEGFSPSAPAALRFKSLTWQRTLQKLSLQECATVDAEKKRAEEQKQAK